MSGWRLAGMCGMQLAGVCMVTLCAWWLAHFSGGFALTCHDSTPSECHRVFNYHPLLMTLGTLFLLGNGQ